MSGCTETPVAATAGPMRSAADGSNPSPSYLSWGPCRGGRREGHPVPQATEPVGAGSVAADISNAVVRLLSDYTGRGPTKARTYLHEDLVSVVLRDTLTKGER